MKNTQIGRSAIAVILSMLSLICFAVKVNAQTSENVVASEHELKLATQPEAFDNYMSAVYYKNGSKVYNTRNFMLCKASNPISSFKINPAGTSCAVLSLKDGESKIAIYDLWLEQKRWAQLKNVTSASTIEYMPNARGLVVATDTELLMCDAKSGVIEDRIAIPFIATQLKVSPNLYHIAATDGHQIMVWNIENKSVRTTLNYSSVVNDIDFSDDSKSFGVLTDDGQLSIYDTQNYSLSQQFDSMGEALCCLFHPEGKYVAVLCSDKRIALVNLKNNSDRNYINNPIGGISDMRFIKDYHGNIMLLYNTNSSVYYSQLGMLTPNYTRLLSDELDDRMNIWMKQMPDESLMEYELRVNDKSREEQMHLFESEIATRMAEHLLSSSEISLGNYNMESQMMELAFDNLPPIFLEMPQEDVNEYLDVENLEFINVKYGLTENDTFEIIYADVVNTITGKSYVYDNMDRRSIEYLKFEEDFVPLEIIQQSNMQELRLQEVKENVMNVAKEQKTISDHTNITAKANVQSSTNADGEKILNYEVDFSYTVEAGFSAQEDFGPGRYFIEESGAAMSMMEVIRQAIEGELAPHVKSGAKLKIDITGMADALPINGRISYDGRYGEYEGEPIYKNRNLSNITVKKSEGISENEQLAFVRALGVKTHLIKSIPSLSTMNIEYAYHIEVNQHKGGEYRRINVHLTFIDAF